MLEFVDLLDSHEDEYAFARHYIDMLLERFKAYQPKVVCWDDPGYMHLAEDETRVVLKKRGEKSCGSHHRSLYSTWRSRFWICFYGC